MPIKKTNKPSALAQEIVGNLFDHSEYLTKMQAQRRQSLFDHFMLAAIEAGHAPQPATEIALTCLRLREETKSVLHALEIDPSDEPFVDPNPPKPSKPTKKVESCAECPERVCKHMPCPHGLGTPA